MTTCACRMCRVRRRRALVRWFLHVAFTSAVGVGAFLVLVGLDRVRAGVVLVLMAFALVLHDVMQRLGDERR